MEKVILYYKSAKQELKSIILNKGIAWGQGLSQNDEPYKWTMDTKAYLLDPIGLKLTTQLFIEKINKYKPDAVGGLTLASHIIASAISYKSNSMDAFLVRRERKEKGILKLIEGPPIKNKKVVIVDDGLNAAGFAKRAIRATEDEGCKVLAVVPLINFERDDDAELKKEGYIVDSIFTLNELGLDSTKHKILDIDRYKLMWRYCTINKTDYTAPKSSPVIEENRIFVGSDQCKMMCFDFDGNIVWQFETDTHPNGIHQTATIVRDKIIFSAYDGGVYALNKDSGELIWKNKASSYCGASTIYDQETNFVFVGLENSTLRGTLASECRYWRNSLGVIY